MKKKCAIYVRTNNEATNIKSIQCQISVLENYINNHELELYNIYSDISTGSTLERPGIQKLIEDAKEKKFEFILVKDFARIARKFELIQQFNKFLEATNIKLITLDDVKATAPSTKGDVGHA